MDEAGSKYGDNILNDYSNRLVVEFGRKYNERTLRRIRQYYRMFKDEKWCRHWRPNYLRVIILNYYLLKKKTN